MLSGARAGHCHRLAAEFATVGQAPAADLPFDPVLDPAVALRHAAVFRHGGGYVIRDLGTRVGTWVNGERVRGERSLEPGDRIRLGADGPELRFDITALADAGVAAVPPAAATPPASAPAPRAAQPVTGATDLSRQLDVVRQTERLRRRLAIAVVLVVAAVAAGSAWVTWVRVQQRAALERERERVLARVDSVHSLLAVARDQAEPLRPMLDSLEREAAGLRVRLTAEAPGAEAIAAMESGLEGTIRRSVPLLEAARFDPGFALADHGAGVVTVRVLVPGREQRFVAGVVAASRGDTAWVVTLRDAVVARDGTPHDSLGVALTRGRIARRARVVATDPAAGLALIRVIPGRVPRLVPLPTDTSAAALRVGDAVAVVGFAPPPPLPEGDDWRRIVVPASAVTATVRSVREGLTLDLYTMARSAGSAVFSSEGRLLGMVADTAGPDPRAARVIPAARMAALVQGGTDLRR